MQWQDEGIILSVRAHGEAHVILDAMTRAHGRHLGFVRGGRSRRMAPTLQPGNRVALTWSSRLDEQMGVYAVEGLSLNAARLMESALSLHALHCLSALFRLLPERDAQEPLFEALDLIIERLPDPVTVGPLMVRVELAILSELGFGLDLERCAATGQTDDLVYVSPKSGRSVSRAAGAAYHDRLLPLPAFVRSSVPVVTMDDLRAGFRLSGLFLTRHVFEPRGLAMPDSRASFIALVTS
jgi:DNA repair protein RecO (recombination protein O)